MLKWCQTILDLKSLKNSKGASLVENYSVVSSCHIITELVHRLHLLYARNKERVVQCCI